ncbi:MAG: hypothetical protein IJ361_01030 [Spirochaetaceae bacterium]|nr:hypothetical protein [Spirochaetaceae bacterium]
MKKSISILFILLTVLVITLFSCQNHLLPSPKVETTPEDSEAKNDTTIIWSAPENLVATHGLKQKIELNWKGVKSATRYFIYEAATPYDKFIQVAETTSNTTNYVLDENSGASKYYKITAVKKDGEESPFSTVAHGTTLANPVITYIGQDEENSDSASSVHWFMNNCNSSTYQENVRYTITCFDPAGNNVAEKIHDGNSDYPSIKFDNLTPNTNYTYQVTAYIVSHQNDTEISDKVDSATTRRLRPNPPENLVATLGTSTTENTLTFDLPAMVDVALGNGIYEPKPLYFKIYRRIASEEATEEDWQIIESKFSKETFGTQYTPSNPEEIYEPGQTVTYTDDKELKRGIMYEYKVQSYADETTREISSNLSYATTQGFLMAVPKFETANYEATKDYKGTADESDDIYTEIKTGFSFTWNMLGYEKDYAYILAEKRYKLEVDNAGEKDEIGEAETYEYFTTLESVNEKVRVFDLTDESNLENIRGYYTYTLYIINNPGENFTLPQPGEPIQNPINVLTAFGTTLVTQDTTAPEITGFTTQDGFKDKVLISWNYDETIAKYTITYELEDGTENVIEDFSAIIEGKENGELITFQHDVESGFSATYTLTALRGISVETEPVTLTTLGTPELSFDAENPKYDTISVKWNPVNKVETYELSYSLDGTTYSDPIIIPTPTEDSINPENFIVNTDGSYTYNFVHPESYDDATKAGKDIQVKIEAKNTLDSTADDITARLLGPALVSTTSLVAKDYTKITTRWNKVNGTKKYLVKRDRYSVDNKTLESSDFYYVDADGSISVQNEEIDTSKYLKVEFENNGTTFILTDILNTDFYNTKWQKNQNKINWGFPYHYTVFPLENENDSFDEETLSLAEKVTYSNLDKIESVGSAIGYGHNVTATKSEDPRKVTITWTKPYLSSTGQYTPILWRSESGKNNWEKTDLSLDGTGKFVFVPKYNERITPYDFAIVYEDTSSKPNQTYLNDLASKVDENGEPHNKGYAFAIATKAENVTVNGEPGYSEKISWTPWDYTKRARGPKQDAIYYVNMKNNNLGAEWINVATYKNDRTITPNTYKETTIAIDGNGVKITPTGLSDNTVHNGLLKVLRDYKHYVQVIVTRENSNGQVITASFADDEENMYAYREVSHSEFSRIATLPMAIGIRAAVNDQGIKWTGGQSGSATAINPGAGTVSIETHGGAFSQVRSDIKFNNYKPVLKTKSEIELTFVTVGTSQLYGNTKDIYGTYCPKFWKTSSEGNMKIIGPSDINLYSGEIFFIADMYPDSTDKIEVTYKGRTVKLPTKDNCAIPFEGTGWLDDTGEWK